MSPEDRRFFLCRCSPKTPPPQEEAHRVHWQSECHIVELRSPYFLPSVVFFVSGGRHTLAFFQFWQFFVLFCNGHFRLLRHFRHCAFRGGGAEEVQAVRPQSKNMQRAYIKRFLILPSPSFCGRAFPRNAQERYTVPSEQDSRDKTVSSVHHSRGTQTRYEETDMWENPG